MGKTGQVDLDDAVLAPQRTEQDALGRLSRKRGHSVRLATETSCRRASWVGSIQMGPNASVVGTPGVVELAGTHPQKSTPPALVTEVFNRKLRVTLAREAKRILLTPTVRRHWYIELRSMTEPTDFPMPEVDPNGVDLAQVRRMLALSPAERLRVLESALASMMKVRDAAQRAQVSRDPAAPR